MGNQQSAIISYINETNTCVNNLKKSIDQLTDIIYLGNDFIGKNNVLRCNFQSSNGLFNNFETATLNDIFNNTINFNHFGNPSINGFQNGGLLFDGNNSNIVINNTENLKLLDEFTIELCVRIVDTNISESFLISKGTTNDLDYCICIWTRGILQYYDDKNKFISGASVTIPDNTKFHTYHFTFKKEGNNTIVKTYLDGNLVGNSVVPYFTLDKSNNNLFIGKAEENSTVYTKMNLKHFSIYNRALSEIEIIHNLIKITSEPYEKLNSNLDLTNIVDGVITKAFIPKSYSKVVPNKWIVFNHGANGSANDINTNQCGTVLQDFLNNGYVVIASDYSLKSCWGNPQSSLDIENLINYYKKIYNLEEKPYVFMQSMGGLVTLNAINKGKLNPKAVFGVFPVCNLRNMWDNGAFTSSINSAYNITNPNDYYIKTNGCDPMLSDFDNFKNIPFFIISSYGDTSASTIYNRDMFKTKLIEAGGYIETVDSSGNHGDLSNYRSDLFIDFISKF